MLHALRTGGLANLHDCPCSLTIPELRGLALSTATPEQLQMAAAGTGQKGMAVEEYAKKMAQDAWGDNLMMALLARCFRKAVSVIASDIARSWLPDGSEQ